MGSITSISRVGVLGHSGSGKTTSAHIILEELRANRYPVVVLDHKNEYSGLPGMAIKTGPQLNPSTLPKILRETNGSVVVQMGAMTLPGKRTWISRFLRSCQTTPRQVPMMIVIEEARLYCPQSGKPVSKEPIIDLASGGRSQGYGCMIISQRASQVDKDAITQLTDLFVFRHPFKTDIQYFEEWLGKDNSWQLQNLQVREGFHVDMKTGLIDKTQFPLSTQIQGAKTPDPIGVDPKKGKLEENVMQKEEKGKGQWLPIVAIVGVVILIVFVVIMIWIAQGKREERDTEEEEKGKVVIIGIKGPPEGPDYLIP